MDDDFKIVVLNIETGKLIPFCMNEFGEVIILSSGIDNTVDSCIVTTWNEITNKRIIGSGI